MKFKKKKNICELVIDSAHKEILWAETKDTMYKNYRQYRIWIRISKEADIINEKEYALILQSIKLYKEKAIELLKFEKEI